MTEVDAANEPMRLERAIAHHNQRYHAEDAHKMSEAECKAARAAAVTHLMSLDGLARALIAQYENLDDRGRPLLPLTKICLPV